MMQYFEWYLPDDGLFWKRTAAKAKAIKAAGIDMIWLPPAYKASSQNDVGYSVYDLYDLGEFDQKGTVRTKYGTREEYENAVRALQKAGIMVLPDIVMNQMIGADGTEEVGVVQDAVNDRLKQISDEYSITAWTIFNFPGRKGRYSKFTWDRTCFTGVDWDEARKQKGMFLFDGKQWSRDVDNENGNFDYLMGCDVDVNEPEVAGHLCEWGKWYYDAIHFDGVRMDALKHIDYDFTRLWLDDIRKYAKKDIFAAGEYWSAELGKLTGFLDETGHTLDLFDVPLHFNFYNAAKQSGNYDMRYILSNSLVSAAPSNAVTFVDNHDTEPCQALTSWVDEWFKPLAYALILLRKDGIPCVFYGDYYGIPNCNLEPVWRLDRLVMIRRRFAYGEQTDYFDDCNVVGWTRSGDRLHKYSGLAVVMSDGAGSYKRMFVGKQFTGMLFMDAMEKCTETVMIDADGWGNFRTDGGNVAVWVRREAYEDVTLMC